ncbi:MAG: tetratricopeptide repeat protein [Elusimicrobia bacterium]|nr:tetratricopeptide repeat protein [Elusimicrobiota bacterium]
MEILFEPKAGPFEKTAGIAGGLVAALLVGLLVLSIRVKYQESRYSRSALGARYRGLADAWAKKGKALPAVHAYGRAILMTPRPNAALYWARGDAWMLLKRYGQAEADYDRAIALAPLAPYPLMAKAMCLALDGRFQPAIGSADSALRLDRNMELAYFWRGFAEDKLGRLREAEGDFTKALVYNKSASNYHLARAAARLKLGDFPGAKEDIDRALRIDPRLEDSPLMRSIRQVYGDFLGTAPRRGT